MSEELPLLWVDLETTGLDPAQDNIIEVAAVVTSEALERLGFEFESLVKPGDAAFDRLQSDEVVRKMHSENGLLADLVEARGPDVLDTISVVDGHLSVALGEWNESNGRESGDKFLLAGSGVSRFDRHFMQVHMPLTYKMLHYSELDISSVRKAWGMWAREPWPGEVARGSGNHRARGDIEAAIAEATAFRDAINLLEQGGSIAGAGPAGGGWSSSPFTEEQFEDLPTELGDDFRIPADREEANAAELDGVLEMYFDNRWQPGAVDAYLLGHAVRVPSDWTAS